MSKMVEHLPPLQIQAINTDKAVLLLRLLASVARLHCVLQMTNKRDHVCKMATLCFNCFNYAGDNLLKTMNCSEARVCTVKNVTW